MKGNIFITVGTGKFDELIRSIDLLISELKLKVIAQIGNGGYIPKNCKFFRYKPSLREEYKKARIIVSHGGAGTTFEILSMGKKLVSIANLERTDVHQEEILKELSKQGYLIWCDNLEKLGECIKKAEHYKFKKYKKPKNLIAKKIEEFLSSC